MSETRGERRESDRGVRLALPCLLLATLSLAAACGWPRPGGGPRPVAKQPAATSRIPVEKYFPLTPRSHWTYRVLDLAKKWTYVNKVQVHGPKYYEALGGEGIEVTERYSSEGGPFYVEESEPIIYFRNEGFLHRMFMTLQAGKLVQASGSGDTRYLPVVLDDGAKWESATQAFRVGGGMSGLGFNVSHRHSAAIETKAVQVPAGSFEDCVRIDTYSTQGPGSGKNGEEIVFYYSDWYAPGVGLIRTEQWDDARREKERTRIELLEYEVAPAAREPAAAEKTS